MKEENEKLKTDIKTLSNLSKKQSCSEFLLKFRTKIPETVSKSNKKSKLVVHKCDLRYKQTVVKQLEDVMDPRRTKSLRRKLQASLLL